MLRMALQSVAVQTAVAKIDRIVVSENGDDRNSRLVCQEFPQLPIGYVFREPALKPLEHAQVLMKELQGDITCILHDDDWWMPDHLEDALASLEAEPEAAAYGANFIFYQEPDLLQRYDLSAWFGANYPSEAPFWRMSHSNVLLASFFGLIVHYSSLVARTATLAQSAFVYDLDNPFDNDRMILLALSRCGPVLFNPEIRVVVRHHQARETSLFDHAERARRMTQTSEWMVGLGLKSWQVIAGAFAKRLAACPDDRKKRDLIRIATLRPWCLPEMARHLDRAADKDFFSMYDQARKAFGGEPPADDPR